MMTTADFLLTATATLCALMAGLFYAWSCSVMPGLARLSDKEFVSAMQSANRAIQNPVFFAAFFGAPIFLLVSAFWFYDETVRFRLLLAATVIYLLGNFGVTVFGNVPMNNALDRFDLKNASEEETARQRTAFERRWTNLNHIRAAASTIALILVIIACLN
jgi:Predicted integral membrane protein